MKWQLSRVAIALALAAAAAAQPSSNDPGPADFPRELRQYLKLTDAEIAFILQGNSRYYRAVADNQTQIFDLQNKIAAETQKDTLDPQALGTFYTGIELLRRDLAKQLGDLRGNLRASLDDTQRGQLDALTQAQGLQRLIGEAQCESLLSPDPGPGNTIPLILPSPVPQGAVRAGNFTACTAREFPQDLRLYLLLSSDQAEAIAGLNRANGQKESDDQQQIAQLQAQISRETARDTIDPLALGALYAQIETIRRGEVADRTALLASAPAVLSDAQRVKLASLDAARKLQPLIGEATCENLLSPPANSITAPTLGSPFPGGFVFVASYCGDFPAQLRIP